jgi:bifunctional UDP-N-acetylglucosamine pyrophosphorylase/glucosamine-1-phosphate N-acetyltransferase
MRSRKAKVLHELCGRPMLAYVVTAARETCSRRPLIVYSPATEAVTEVFAGEADFAIQKEPLGTADAVRAAMAAMPEATGEVLVLSGDVPLVQADLLAELIDLRRARNAAVALVAVHTLDPEGLGRVVRSEDGGQVLRIVEEKDATPEELEIEEINAGVYAFEEDGTLAGINDRSQLALAEMEMRMIVNERHMQAGVTMVDPVRTYVDVSVELASDVVLEPGVILRGNTKIGQGTRIGAGSFIIDTVIGRNCYIWASVLESSEVEDEVQIGPFSHLRSKSSIGRKVKLGNFAEVKASRLEAGVQQHHFSYIGDAELGERTNVGAGTVTCNFDGVRKHKTKTGKNVFLGSDTMLVAPVELGDGARTGAGSVVTKDVPAGMLAVGVPARLRKPRVEVTADVPATPAPAAQDPATEGTDR